MRWPCPSVCHLAFTAFEHFLCFVLLRLVLLAVVVRVVVREFVRAWPIAPQRRSLISAFAPPRWQPPRGGPVPRVLTHQSHGGSHRGSMIHLCCLFSWVIAVVASDPTESTGVCWREHSLVFSLALSCHFSHLFKCLFFSIIKLEIRCVLSHLFKLGVHATRGCERWAVCCAGNMRVVKRLT